MDKDKKVDWIPCPGDLSNLKIRGMALCRDCKKQFDREVGDAVLEGTTPPTYEGWIRDRVTALLPELEEAAREAEEALSAVKEQSEECLNEMFDAAVAGQTLSLDQLRAAKSRLRETKGKEVWESLEGNKVFRQNKVAEARLAEAKRLLKDLEAKAPASVTVTPAPASEDPDPATPKPKATKKTTKKKGDGGKSKKIKEAREREASEDEA